MKYTELLTKLKKDEDNEYRLDIGEILYEFNIDVPHHIQDTYAKDYGFESYYFNSDDVDSESGTVFGCVLIFYKNNPVAIGEVEYESFMVRAWFDTVDLSSIHADLCEIVFPAFKPPKDKISFDAEASVDAMYIN